jgi:NAD(P)-dependent dehydrogenase (short-subunit alcohol dehydrogenase family)
VERFRKEFGDVEVGTYAGAAEYRQLFERVKARVPESKSINIVHMGCLAGDGFQSLFSIAQAIGDAGISIPIRIAVVSSCLHEVTGDEALDPFMATVMGPVGVIPKEFSNVECFNVDLPSNETERFIDRILSEFSAAKNGDVIAYRGKHRWIRKYERVHLPAPAAIPKRLKERGVYLITGGAGGIGMAVAKYLAETCRARLILTKKTAVQSERITRDILEVERLGGTAEIVVADVTDREEMRKVIDETLRKFNSIDGVIHAAGTVNAGLIQTKTKDNVQSIMAPKVDGTIILHELVKNLPLDFFVLFSSMTSVTTPHAEIDYAGANAFLDAFAHYSNAQGRFPTLAINWPGWKEAGLLAELKMLPGTEWWKQQALEKAILTKDGIEAFRRALNSDLAQVIVSPEDVDSLIEHSRDEAALWQKHSAPREAVAVETDAAEESGDPVEAILTTIWKNAFGLQRIGVNEDFLSIGGHSLLAMKIVSDARSSFQVDFSLRSFFDAPTIAQQSAIIRDEIFRKIGSMTAGG